MDTRERKGLKEARACKTEQGKETYQVPSSPCLGLCVWRAQSRGAGLSTTRLAGPKTGILGPMTISELIAVQQSLR
jgi:hypothetical protein